MLRKIVVLLLSLCILCGAVTAAQPSDEQAAKEQKALQKAQKKKIRQEIRYFESLRNKAVVNFAKENPPKDIQTPFGTHFRISNVVCAGDKVTGTVVLHLTITPLYGGIRLYMGGNRNGSEAFADGERYPSQDLYGRIYTLRGGQPEQIIVLFDNIAAGTKKLDRVHISMGLAQNVMNLITLQNIPIFWTYSDKFIGNYVRQNEKTTTVK